MSWAPTKDRIVIHDPHAFAKEVLPRYFKHNVRARLLGPFARTHAPPTSFTIAALRERLWSALRDLGPQLPQSADLPQDAPGDAPGPGPGHDAAHDGESDVEMGRISLRKDAALEEGDLEEDDDEGCQEKDW